MLKQNKYIYLFLLICLCYEQGYAQSQEKIYSLFILNFARGIQWPTTTNDFVMGVLEYPPLVQELKTSVEGMKIGTQTIVVKEYLQPQDVEKCNVLFVPAYKIKTLPAILAKLGKHPTLVVTNRAGYAQKGGGINLLLLEGKLKYEINCKLIESLGMKVSSNLKLMGIVVE